MREPSQARARRFRFFSPRSIQNVSALRMKNGAEPRIGRALTMAPAESSRPPLSSEMTILGAQLRGLAAGDQEGIPVQHGRMIAGHPSRAQAMEHGQVQGGEPALRDAVYPLQGARLVADPAAVHGVFQSLREVEGPDGQRRAREVQQPQQPRHLHGSPAG